MYIAIKERLSGHSSQSLILARQVRVSQAKTWHEKRIKDCGEFHVKNVNRNEVHMHKYAQNIWEATDELC